MPLVELLLHAHDRKLSGTFELSAPPPAGATASFLLVEGNPAKVRTSEPGPYLGGVLLEVGDVTDEQLTQSLAELAKAKAAGPALHGQLLLAAGILSAEQLRAALRAQLVRKLVQVAAMPPATAFAYYKEYNGLQGWGLDGERGFDALPISWALLREARTSSRVAAALDRLGDAPLRLSASAELTRLELRPEERATAELLRIRPMRAAELVAGCGLPPLETQVLFYFLLLTKQIEVVQAAPAPALAQQLAERRREIVDRAATAGRADYFDLLGISRTATSEDVEAAFFALARRWHPDSLPRSLADLREECSRVFARMVEASKTLANEEKRAHYRQALAAGAQSRESQETSTASSIFEKAEICFRRQDYDKAEELCREAVEHDPTHPDYHALLAWLQAQKPEYRSRDKTEECIAMLDHAIKIDSLHARAYFWRGSLYKRIGRSNSAARDFKHAAELDPQNIDAVREMRLYGMRGGDPANPKVTRYPVAAVVDESEKPGIIGRVFKKP